MQPLSRRATCLCAGFALAALGSAACGSDEHGAEAPARDQPNILLLVADDLGWGDVGFHGSEIRTPHLDQLASEGVELSRFYSFPLCSPARYALVTGRHPARDGWLMRPLQPWETNGLDAERTTLAEMLRDAGYRTALIGKWHLGHANQTLWPQAHGFDHFYGCLNGIVDYYRHTSKLGSRDWQRNGVSLDEEGYSTDLIAREAERFILDVDAEAPWFALVSFNAPHTPYLAPEALIQSYAHIEDEQRRIYAAMVESLDLGIGRVLAALDQSGSAANTLVLFFSDHGNSTLDAGVNEPLPGGKGRILEGGIRVPAVLRWPAAVAGGVANAQMLTILDLYPTLAAAGKGAADSNTLDGENMLPSLVSGARVDGRTFMAGTGARNRFDFCWIEHPWKLCSFGDRETGAERLELYHLEDDPFEANNLADSRPEVVKRLTPSLREWMSRVPRTAMPPKKPPSDWRPPGDWIKAPAR